MTIRQLYRIFLAQLEQIYSRNEAAVICDLLFEKKAGISKLVLLKEPDLSIDTITETTLHSCLFDLLGHKPIQYVTGEAWFCDMNLKVSPAVLIPRPETGELVGRVTGYLKAQPAGSLVDIGTGSGCIAIAIKKKLPQTIVHAIDISNGALEIAAENARDQKVNILWQQMDFLDEATWQSLPLLDVIVSNPPYIPEYEKQLLEKNVSDFEPHLALFIQDENPLIFYQKIAEFGKKHLNEKGKIFLETHEQFAKETALIFNDDFYHSEIIQDLHGKQRFITATRRSL